MLRITEQRPVHRLERCKMTLLELLARDAAPSHGNSSSAATIAPRLSVAQNLRRLSLSAVFAREIVSKRYVVARAIIESRNINFSS